MEDQDQGGKGREVFVAMGHHSLFNVSGDMPGSNPKGRLINVLGCIHSCHGFGLDLPGSTQEAMALSSPVFMSLRFPMSNLLNCNVFGYLESSAHIYV